MKTGATYGVSFDAFSIRSGAMQAAAFSSFLHKRPLLNATTCFKQLFLARYWDFATLPLLPLTKYGVQALPVRS